MHEAFLIPLIVIYVCSIIFAPKQTHFNNAQDHLFIKIFSYSPTYIKRSHLNVLTKSIVI